MYGYRKLSDGDPGSHKTTCSLWQVATCTCTIWGCMYLCMCLFECLCMCLLWAITCIAYSVRWILNRRQTRKKGFETIRSYVDCMALNSFAFVRASIHIFALSEDVLNGTPRAFDQGEHCRVKKNSLLRGFIFYDTLSMNHVRITCSTS